LRKLPKRYRRRFEILLQLRRQTAGNACAGPVAGDRRRIGARRCGEAERMLAKRGEGGGICRSKRQRRRGRPGEPQRQRQHRKQHAQPAHRPTISVHYNPGDGSARHIRPQPGCRVSRLARIPAPPYAAKSSPHHNQVTGPSIGRCGGYPIGYAGAAPPPQPAAFERLPYAEARQPDRDVAGALQQ